MVIAGASRGHRVFKTTDLYSQASSAETNTNRLVVLELFKWCLTNPFPAEMCLATLIKPLEEERTDHLPCRKKKKEKKNQQKQGHWFQNTVRFLCSQRLGTTLIV